MTYTDKNDSLYHIHYRDPKTGEPVNLKANSITDSSLGLSFIAISNFVFETEGLVVKPTEEQLKKRLEDVKTLHISIYSILSIEEIGRKPLKFNKDKSNILILPSDSHNPPPVN